MPSFILIHPTVWPQYTNVTNRQDNSPVAHSEPLGLLVTVAQKLHQPKGHVSYILLPIGGNIQKCV